MDMSEKNTLNISSPADITQSRDEPLLSTSSEFLIHRIWEIGNLLLFEATKVWGSLLGNNRELKQWPDFPQKMEFLLGPYQFATLDTLSREHDIFITESDSERIQVLLSGELEEGRARLFFCDEVLLKVQA